MNGQPCFRYSVIRLRSRARVARARTWPPIEDSAAVSIIARQVHNRDIAPVLAAAEGWINTCLIDDRSILSNNALWTAPLINEVYQAFVKHPDYGQDDFMTKLKGQMAPASARRSNSWRKCFGRCCCFHLI
jgi:hypothetical protein